MRALQDLSATLPPPQSSTTQPTPSHHCAEVAVEKILSTLSPLVKSLQGENLRNNLLALAQSAMDIWYSAQTDKLHVIVYPILDPGSREEWRSSTLDPDTGSDIISSALPRMLSLEKKQRELKAKSERSGKHSRSGSMVAPESPSLSPSALWMREGRKNVIEQ